MTTTTTDVTDLILKYDKQCFEACHQQLGDSFMGMGIDPTLDTYVFMAGGDSAATNKTRILCALFPVVILAADDDSIDIVTCWAPTTPVISREEFQSLPVVTTSRFNNFMETYRLMDVPNQDLHVVLRRQQHGDEPSTPNDIVVIYEALWDLLGLQFKSVSGITLVEESC